MHCVCRCLLKEEQAVGPTGSGDVGSYETSGVGAGN